MRVQCPECGAGGNIPSEKIPAAGRKIVCPKCKHSFLVKREGQAEAPATVNQAANAASYYQQGVKLLKAKQLDAAIEKLSAVVQTDPGYADAYRYLGLAYGQKQLWDEAIQVLQKALAHNATDLLSLKNLGVAYLRQERFAEAEEVLNRVLQQTPQDERVKSQLKMAARGRRQAEKAAAAGQEDDGLEGFSLDSFASDAPASKTTPPAALPENPVQAFLDKGVEFIDNRQYNKAVECFEEATRLAPDSSDGHFGLGMVYEKKQEWNKAIDAYQKALDVNPNDTLAKENLRYLKKRKKKRFKFFWQKG